MATTEKVLLFTFEEIVERSGQIAAMNAWFGAHGNLPDEKVPGEYYEALGDPCLGEDVEAYIKSNFSH